MDMTAFVPREFHMPLRTIRTKFDDWVLFHPQTESEPPTMSLNPKGCDRAGARDYAAFLGFLFLEPS